MDWGVRERCIKLNNHSRYKKNGRFSELMVGCGSKRGGGEIKMGMEKALDVSYTGKQGPT